MSAHRPIGLSAGIAGAAGVATLAVGAHAITDANLDVAGSILLFHAAALLALANAGGQRLRGLSALLFVAGCLMFSGDLIFKAVMARSLFPLAAPSGGVALILGWLAVAVGALLPRRI
ncbi:conserved membrane hypothetical protein [uncultured Pleomorphomonas sp.]|uniref:DUF423 domain-containing protein n=2 Tax=Pleomorphomonas TaxID=261933 RepID=A0A2G9WWJ7_9HYPH|nr:DUF423 domain-containing protein [Pleomorphomonas carboxyditropha]PIO99078.1 hypothetical protein CJ014_11415 [Pleomorphomonas carboxyditropha]SCM70619.1 conserved membrane hypothetical protein [uncultured Pleomorphomonas sp.]